MQESGTRKPFLAVFLVCLVSAFDINLRVLQKIIFTWAYFFIKEFHIFSGKKGLYFITVSRNLKLCIMD